MASTTGAIAPDNLADLVHGLSGWGERTALRHRTEYRGFSWSYRSLHDAALRMAGLLQDHFIQPGERVMLWAPNGPPWIVAFLGCLLHGSVAVPLDLRSRPPFLRDVARETGAKLLLRGRFQPDHGLDLPTIVADDLVALLAPFARLHPALPALAAHHIAENDVAEVVYTSGTVARPKGVILTHRNLTAELRSIAPVVPPEPEYRFLAVLPFSHIFAQVVDLLLPLSRGATIVTLEAAKPAAIATALRRERITVFAAVPRLLELLRHGVLREVGGAPLGGPLFALLFALAPHLPFAWRSWLFWPLHHTLAPQLRYTVSGGAALDPALERFWDHLGFLLLQGYGLTETASAVSCDRVDARRIGSVGKVLPGQQVRVGARDELLVRGPNVTPGYFANPAATAAAFEDGWFKTGDVGRFDRDGFLYLKGRLKEVIVTSAGINVYPEDVEAALNRQPGVRDSAVLEWHHRVHAVLLLDPGAHPRHIVARANAGLDSAQQVQDDTVWPFPDFPRTATLKVRKQDVLDFLQRHSLPPAVVAQVRGPLTALVALIARLAPVPPAAIRPEATLGFDLKLSSLDRLALVSLVEQELNVDLAEEEVTARTTVGQLERMINERPPLLRRAFPRWARWPFVRALRRLLQRYLLFPFVRAFVHLRVEGLEHLAGLPGPCVFAANHQSYLDPAVIALALPERFRRYTAVAAWAEYFEAPDRSWPVRLLRRLEFYAVVLLLNAFPLSQTRIFRPSIQYMGELVEEGDSILVFPEGRRTPTGEIFPFKEGIGLIATALRVPIVPVRLEGLFHILYRGARLPRPGPALVTFGPPLSFEDQSFLQIARQVAAAVNSLWPTIPP